MRKFWGPNLWKKLINLIMAIITKYVSNQPIIFLGYMINLFPKKAKPK